MSNNINKNGRRKYTVCKLRALWVPQWYYVYGNCKGREPTSAISNCACHTQKRLRSRNAAMVLPLSCSYAGRPLLARVRMHADAHLGTACPQLGRRIRARPVKCSQRTSVRPGDGDGNDGDIDSSLLSLRKAPLTTTTAARDLQFTRGCTTHQCTRYERQCH